jgi:DNA-binding NtrC family response regulator
MTHLSNILLKAHAVLVVGDPAMADLVQRVTQIAPGSAAVMISGECGTGKELVAAHLHRQSGRDSQRFSVLPCTAIPEAALEEALFGPDSGAFAGGTLLLDEIGDMELPQQAQLLRALQLHEGQRAAGGQPVRIVTTTSRNLQEDMRNGRFRADLFFRLNVIALKVPPLRDRPDDVPVLAHHFAEHFARSNRLPASHVLPETMALLQLHRWPGNVRELRNVMHRAVLMETGPRITPRSLDFDPPVHAAAHQPPAEGLTRDVVPTSGRTIEAVEKDMILEALRQTKGNRGQTALVLGISIRTLRNKLHEYERDGTRIPRPVVIAVA